MKHQLLNLLLALMLGGATAYGQGSLGPHPKKARTPDDYKLRSLKEVAARGLDMESRRDNEDTVIVQGDIFPSRVRVVYAGRARMLPQIKKQVLHRWAQRYAGAPEHYTVPYETELLFKEQGIRYWLAIRKQSMAQFKKKVRKGEAVELFLIRLGGAGVADEWEPLLLVESFQKPK